LAAYYGRQGAEFHLPLNFALMDQPKLDAAAFRAVVGKLEQDLGPRPITYVLSSHDVPRAVDTFGDGVHDDQIAKLLSLLLLTLRGVPILYYGEELGMQTTPPEHIEDVQDPVGKVFWPQHKGRDGERTPMQWTSGRNAGFSSAEKPWLPVPPTAQTRNVEVMADDPDSILTFYKRAIRLRRASPALLEGEYAAMGDDSHVFAYRRRAPTQTIIVALNMSDAPRTVKLSAGELGGKGKGLRLALSNLRHGVRQPIDAGHLTLAPYEAAAFEVTGK
jgi:alpha-glucosidase